MNIDIRMFGMVLGLNGLLQAMALGLHHRVVREARGDDWWVAGAFLFAGAFGFACLRGIPRVDPVAVVAVNGLFVLGLSCLKIGADRFLGKRGGFSFVAALALVAIAFAVWLTFTVKAPLARRAEISLALTLLSFMLAKSFLFDSRGRSRFSAALLGLVFLLNGLFFVLRGLATVSPRFSSLLPSELVLQATYADLLLCTNLWTFGFIILRHQRLAAELEFERNRFRVMFKSSPDAVLITRLDDGLIVDVSDGFSAMTGHPVEAVVGKTTLELGLWLDAEDRRVFVETQRRDGSCDNMEFLFRRRDGSVFPGLQSARLMHFDGEAHILNVIRDVTALKRTEERVRELLAEKELVLREVHHRIKNNMNSVASLLSLQAASSESREVASALEDAVGRVGSMMVLYDRLYRFDFEGEFSVADYLPNLVDRVVEGFPPRLSLRVEKRIGDFSLDVRSLSTLGIIVNELLSNIRKYAFLGRSEGLIEITALLEGEDVRVEVRDDGAGMPVEDARRPAGFGLELVTELTRQLGGRIDIDSPPGGGTRIAISFPRGRRREADPGRSR